MRNVLISFIIALLCVPVITIGQEQYRDVTEALAKLVAVQEKYISSIKKATKSDEVASAMRELNSELGTLHISFRELEKKYPSFSVIDPKLSPEIKVLIASCEQLSKQLTETTIINLYRYGNDEVVATEIGKTKEFLRSITSFTDEKKESPKN